ncbi:MAG: TraR/DksA family transcriptional regulator, partial [Vicinamibacteria bacterium]
IEHELAEVYRASESLKKEPRPEELETLGDNTPLTEEGDNALLVEGIELRSDLLQRLLERAKALEDARLRLDEGTYGICIDCGKEIPSKRLEAVPEALRCREDQEKAERFEVPERTTL